MTDKTAKPEIPAVSGFGPWMIAGTPVGQPYPCRCHESKFGRCSPLWCPCAGRPDIFPEPCCSGRFGPAEWKAANTAWEAKRRAAG